MLGCHFSPPSLLVSCSLYLLAFAMLDPAIVVCSFLHRSSFPSPLLLVSTVFSGFECMLSRQSFIRTSTPATTLAGTHSAQSKPLTEMYFT